MKSLLSIFLLLFLALPVSAERYGADADAQPGDAGKTMDAQPAAPQNLKVAITQQTLDLSWENSSEEQDQIAGYEVARANNYSGPYTAIATVEKGVFRYVDTAVSPEVVYFYKVRAVSGSKYSSYSSTVTGEIPVPGHEKGRRR